MVDHVHEPHIVCPKCSHLIPLTESIAAPLLEAERKHFQQKLAAREAEFGRKADDLRRQQVEVAEARESIEEQVRHLLAAKQTQVAATEEKKAREQVAGDLAAVRHQLAENEQLLKV